MNNLIVSECFYSIQGEGQTMGVPAVFLRMAGCNLLCKSEHWVCDSIDVWQKGVKTSFEDVFKADYIDKLRDGAHLVITGGEPLLHQKKLTSFLHWFMDCYKFCPIIEVETNGTITPMNDFNSFVNFWNVSPKLENSGEPYNKRVNLEAIQYLRMLGAKTIFKFVIAKKTDLLSISLDYGKKILPNQIVLMPAGETQSELESIRQEVAELCIEYKFRYSERLHIVIWNKKTGV